VLLVQQSAVEYQQKRRSYFEAVVAKPKAYAAAEKLVPCVEWYKRISAT
jgi:hypothetical protein